MSDNLRIGIIGEGSWATALVKLIQNNVQSLTWLIRDAELIGFIKENRHNPLYLSDVEIMADNIQFSADVREVVTNSDIIIIALPTAFIESALETITPRDFQNKFVFSAAKGIIPENHLTVCSYLNNVYEVPKTNLGFISGPSHAEEIALERMTFLTVLSENKEIAEYLSGKLRCRFMKIIVSDDITGAEYASALKNVMAIAAGICHGLGYGDNFIAVLVSNAIREIRSFLYKVTTNNRDLLNFVYLGDLLVTCYSQFSRNRTFGTMLGKGYTVKTAQLEMNMIAEGYYTVKSIIEIIKEADIEMPIVQAVYRILYEKYSPSVEMKLLTDKLK